jgi:hypothetical protein
MLQDKESWTCFAEWDFEKRVAVLQRGTLKLESTDLVKDGNHVVARFAHGNEQIAAKVLRVWWDVIHNIKQGSTAGASPMFRPLDAAERRESTRKEKDSTENVEADFVSTPCTSMQCSHWCESVALACRHICVVDHQALMKTAAVRDAVAATVKDSWM